MRPPGELPPALRTGSFTRAGAAQLGVSFERLRRRDLHRPYYGVRSRAAPAGQVEMAHAYRPRLSERGFFSHTTAAALWGLPLPAWIDPAIHVSQPHGERAARTAGVIGHHLVITSAELTRLDGISVTTPERTWTDLAGWLPLEDLVAAGDRTVWYRDPLTSLQQLTEMAIRHPGRRGRRDRLGALELLSDRAYSAPESILRTRIVLSGLPIPVANPLLRGPSGEWIGQPDLAFPEYREVLEYEGDGHRTDRSQWRVDVARVPRFEDFGWHVNRATGDDLRDGSRRILGVLERRLREKGWQPARAR